MKILRDKEWQIERKLVLREGNIYMPKEKELRIEIIQLYHDALVVEHREQ